LEAQNQTMYSHQNQELLFHLKWVDPVSNAVLFGPAMAIAFSFPEEI
jgi:hypothetical protein